MYGKCLEQGIEISGLELESTFKFSLCTYLIFEYIHASVIWEHLLSEILIFKVGFLYI